MADHEAHLAFEDKAHRSPRNSGRRGGRGGRSGGGRSEGREVQVSKALSKLLRHQAENAGIKLDEEGFAPLDRVVSSLYKHTISLHNDFCKLYMCNSLGC